MNRKTFLNIWKIPSLALAMVAITATPSFAQTVELAAVPGQWTPPPPAPPALPGAPIAMWGFIPVADAATYDCATASPTDLWEVGPTLTATEGGTLTVNVRNCLSEPVSIFIPGQLKGTVPEFFMDNAVPPRRRVRSFDVETLSGGVGSYTWMDVKEGTYLYHSGTQAQVQVQMGLYGALVVTGGSYPPYAQDQVLVYSEIDPDLHAAVALDDYGPGKGTTSTFEYKPRYFLINGKFFDKGDPNANDIAVDVSANVLLRFVNAGLKTHVPTLGGGLYMSLIAEDGNLAPPEPVRLQYGVELSAGKTFDALLNVGSEHRYALYDRALNLGNNSAIDGGMLIYIAATDAVGAPKAVPDGYNVTEDGTLTTTAGDFNPTLVGVLDNDTDALGGPLPVTAIATLVSAPSAGTLSGGLAADGSFIYVPNADFNGTDIFTYRANEGIAGPDSNLATVTITVTAVNDGPVANPDAYDAAEGGTLSVAAPGVLGNDDEIEGDGLTASGPVLGTEPLGALTFNADGSFEYTPVGLAGAVETFDYEACDVPPMPLAQICSTATVTITVVPAASNIPPTANDDGPFEVARTTNTTTTSLVLNVASDITDNDTDANGTIVDSTLMIINPVANLSPLPPDPNLFTTQRGGTVRNNGDGTLTFFPKKNFRGTDTFQYTVDDDDGDTSNAATVRINVVK